MNILLITEFFPKSKKTTFLGGVQGRNFFIVKYLKKSNDIKIINFKQGKIEATSQSLIPRLWFAVKVIFTKLEGKPDVIEASNTTTYLPAFILAKRLGVPAVAWVPDILGQSWKEHFSLPVAIAGQLLERLSLALSWDQIIAMSNSTKDKLTKIGKKEDNISVVYGGVEFDKLNKLKAEKFKNPTVCTISRLVDYKRIPDLLKAISIVKKKIPSIHCLIIGKGPQKDSLKIQINNLKLSKQVKLLGSMPHQEAMKKLKSSHLFCLPSIVEGFGIVTVEAMASGVPFVSSRIKPTQEITENGKGGLLFEPKNSEDLAQKIIVLLNNKSLYQKKITEGKILAKKYHWKKIALETKQAYKKAIDD